MFDIDSVPPARTTLAWPRRIWSAAFMIARSPEPQAWLTVYAGTSWRSPALDGDLPRHIRSDARLPRVAEDHFVDGVRIDAAARERRFRAGGSELGGGERRQAAAEFSDRRADGGDEVDRFVQLRHSAVTVSAYVCTDCNKSFFPIFSFAPCASRIEPGPNSSGLPSAPRCGTSVLNATTRDVETVGHVHELRRVAARDGDRAAVPRDDRLQFRLHLLRLRHRAKNHLALGLGRQ